MVTINLLDEGRGDGGLYACLIVSTFLFTVDEWTFTVDTYKERTWVLAIKAALTRVI